LLSQSRYLAQDTAGERKISCVPNNWPQFFLHRVEPEEMEFRQFLKALEFTRQPLRAGQQWPSEQLGNPADQNMRKTAGNYSGRRKKICLLGVLVQAVKPNNKNRGEISGVR
jgi:hypothetical protein